MQGQNCLRQALPILIDSVRSSVRIPNWFYRVRPQLSAPFPPVCIILIILVQPFCVVEVDTDRDELAISYHRILYGEYQRKRHVFSEVVTIEMYEYKKYSTTNGVLELLAIIIRFPRDMSVFQSINSVEQTKKHFAWLKQMAERLD